MAKEKNGSGGEISAATINVGADHGDEGIGFGEGRKQVSGGKFGVIGYGIGAADFEFDPEIPGAVFVGEEEVGAGGVAEKTLDILGERMGFEIDAPA